ncbi:MAG: hypothetical protein IKS45_09360 [Thermoguttaceae bacterium]|nr:hypothetical protein [Thermoguttaceae bacterium]MBR6436701.1 hypothetical protein [Thermoguttaceae bacterium]
MLVRLEYFFKRFLFCYRSLDVGQFWNENVQCPVPSAARQNGQNCKKNQHAKML